MDALSNLAFTTSGALIDLVDSQFLSLSPLVLYQSSSPVLYTPTEKVLVHLRDGRKLIGVLRSYDQYGPSLAHPCCPTAFANLQRPPRPSSAPSYAFTAR